MDNQQELDWEDISEFFKEQHKDGIRLVKRKMFYAFQKYIKGTREAYKEYTKGMTKEQREDFDVECEEGDPEEYASICEEVADKLMDEYKVEIQQEEYDIHIWSYELDYFWISLDLTASDYTTDINFEPKIEDNYQIELNGNAMFIVNLINKRLLDFWNKTNKY